MSDSNTPAEFLISVVLVNWNSRDDLRACLQSLQAQTDARFEIIVVDNGSQDGSLEMLREEFPQVRAVPTGENLGFAEGCNRGIDVARGEWIALLNNDTVAAPNWLSELRRYALELPPDVGALQSKLVFRDEPNKINSAGILLFGNATARDRLIGEPDREQQVEEIFAVTAGAALYRRAMLEQVRERTGVLDRGFFMYFEDVDLGWRCRLAGWRAFYVPTSVVAHAFQQSTKRHQGDFVGWHSRKNRLRSLAKNASATYALRSLPKTLSDVVWILRVRGVAGLQQTLGSCQEGFELRSRARRTLRTSRRAVERRWVTRRR